MDNPDPVKDNYPIHAYLSYRCKIDRDIQARDTLEALCVAQEITLRYDESETREGDSLIEFMADLSAARCVFLFLSPKYFQSAYTLFELIRIAEQGDLDASFILPIRLSETMVTYQWTTAKSHFYKDEEMRNELARLLKVENTGVDQMWQRIDAAWHKSIFPSLDILNVSLENNDADIACKDLLVKTQASVSRVIKQSTDELHSTIIKKISNILNRNNINANDKFREELELSNNNDIEQIAEAMVALPEVSDALAILTRISEEKRALLTNNSQHWKPLFVDVEQLCGWLLIKSVDPVWWFHHEIKLKNTLKGIISDNLVLQDPHYVEVIISRSLLQNAQYALDKNKQAKAARHQHDLVLFDSFTDMKDELLRGIYNDLYGVQPSKDLDLLDEIVSRVQANYKTYKGKITYYLVSQDYINELKRADWYPEIQKQLAGYLQFICCQSSTQSKERHASMENQKLLLNQVAKLIALEKQE